MGEIESNSRSKSIVLVFFQSVTEILFQLSLSRKSWEILTIYSYCDGILSAFF